jgi:probable HAF family extracellular repeat protein
MRKYWIRLVLGVMLAVLMAQGYAIAPGYAGAPAESSAALAPLQFRIRDLGTLGGSNSAATAVNVNDQIAGWSEMVVGGTDRHAFLWEGGRMRDLGTLGGANSEARGINRRGWVVGASQTAAGATHAFLWRNGKMTDLGTLGGAASEANAINDEGTIVGSSESADGTERAFAWEYGTLRALPLLDCGTGWGRAFGVNRDGQIVGTQRCAGPEFTSDKAVMWNETSMTALPVVGPREIATGINHQEQILVNSNNNRVQLAYVMVEGPAGPLTELGSLVPEDSCAGTYTSASGINEAGLIVGFSESVVKGGCPNPGIHYGFLWRRGAMYSLGTLTGEVKSYSEAYAISNENLMVGASWDAVTGFQHAVLWRIR